jgi:diguanylate cyclase (GGDEF)-like protein/hemerythrin-like metal-binding protein
MLVAQLDYIYFFFGLVLFLLGSVCVSMSRSAPVPTPWWLLGIFAFVHGAGEWLQLLALTGGDSELFSLARTVVIGASFVVLLEFARRTSGVLGGTTPCAWVYLPTVATVLGVALTAGPASLDSAVRLFIGAPASFWTASLFFMAASRTEDLGGGEASWRARILGGLFFVAFGIAAGLVVPSAPYLTERWPNPEAFLAWTGIPIQLLRGLLVSGMALAVWALAVSFDPKGRVLRKKRILFWAMASAIVALLAAGWIFTDRLGRLHEADVIRDAESSASQTYDHLIMEMEAVERGARTLGELLARYHVSPAGLDVTRLDGVVDSLALGSANSVVYVLDAAGTTIASSNRDLPDSFLGKSFARRPYFEAARDGRPGRFTGIGLVSHVPGYYASEPVRDPSGRLLAVAVVKQNLATGLLGPLGGDDSSIVTSDGRIVVASRPGGMGRRLWSAPGRPSRPVASDGGPGEPPPVLDREVRGTEWVSLDGQKYVAIRRPIPNSDWSLVAFKKERTQVANRLLGIVITLLLCAVVLTYFVAMQRQLSAESYIRGKRREAEGRAREMAKRADTDALTGVLNRMGFNDAMSRELGRARRYGQTLSVAIVDIDHFKRVNDEFGHPVGDQVLARTAKLLSSCVRESDTVARWGGEEFALIAPMTTEDGAASLAEKLRSIMAATHLGPKDAVTASFGVAELRPDDTVETLLARADAALYRAKQSGRNQVCRAGAEQAPSAQAQAVPEGERPVPERTYANTGFGPIDDEHEALDRALDAFVSTVNSGKVAEVRVALDELILGIESHFAHEERLMSKHAYPNQKQHGAAHTSFVVDMRKTGRELERDEVSPDFRRWAVSRLPDWFRFHILTHDIGLGKFLLRAGAGHREKGAQPPGAGEAE